MLSILKELFSVETLKSFWQKLFTAKTLFCTFLPVYMQKFSSVLLLMVVISCNCMPQSPLWRGGCKRKSHSSSSEMTERLIRHKLSILLLKLQYSVPTLNNPDSFFTVLGYSDFLDINLHRLILVMPLKFKLCKWLLNGSFSWSIMPEYLASNLAQKRCSQTSIIWQNFIINPITENVQAVHPPLPNSIANFVRHLIGKEKDYSWFL